MSVQSSGRPAVCASYLGRLQAGVFNMRQPTDRNLANQIGQFIDKRLVDSYPERILRKETNPFSANNETAAFMITLRVYSAGRVIDLSDSNNRLNQIHTLPRAKTQLSTTISRLYSRSSFRLKRTFEL
jgi:hypothetical protein